MNTQDFQSILQQPQQISAEQTEALYQLMEQYPYLQCVRALHLKGLKNQDSYKYNYALKKTAAYTTDRSILFEYITSDDFLTKKKPQSNLEKALATISASPYDNLDIEHPTLNEKVLDPDLFETKAVAEDTATEEEKIEEKLNIGTPLSFEKNEKHSFNEWLQLTHAQPIKRNKPQPQENEEEKEDEQNKTTAPSNSKFDLIDKFIAENPKIKPRKKVVSLKNLAKENSIKNDELMTETLARVYLEQKNYKKAIQAYRILSLKNPEKSSFFADQISEIEKLEKINLK